MQEVVNMYRLTECSQQVIETIAFLNRMAST